MFKQITNEFFSNSTVHGLPFFVKRKLHYLERIFWVVIVCIASGFAIHLCLTNWNRFSANPTVVTIQKDFRNWNNYFPAATGCYLTKYNEELAQKYIYEKWGLDMNHSSYNYYLDFIRVVTNVSFDNLHEFKRFENDELLNNLDMLDLTVKVFPLVGGTLVTFDTTRKSIWKYVMTELGLCFSVNSKLGHLFGINVRGDNRSLIKDDYVLKCHYLNGLCYARYDAEPTALQKLYIHSYLDIVHATIDSPLVIKESEELEINYRMQETTANERLRQLNPVQRRCRFHDEPISEEYSAYSSSICFIICRYRLVMQLCKCRPFFYHNLKGKLCDIKGLLCVAYHSSKITQNPSTLGCKCPQDCNLIKYLPMEPKRTVWQYGYFDMRITFRWGLLAPTTKYNRDILFGIEDLVVSFGGILALFLGVSFISAIEVVIYLLQLFCTIFYKKKAENELKIEKINLQKRHYKGDALMKPRLKNYY